VSGSIVTGMYKIAPSWGISARVGVMDNQPSVGPSGTTVTSPMLIGTYALALDDWRLAFGFGVSAPIGSGGGNNPDPGVALANKQANYARSAYDGPLFNPNNTYLTPSADVAYVAHGLTVHYDLALSQAFRVQGDLKTPDSSVTTLLTGLHVGYFVVPMFSIGAEMRYQRFLTTFTPLCTSTSSQCDNLTIAEGVRLHFKTGKNYFRPGLSLTQGLRGPVADQGFEVVQLDLPVSF
jgi:hypothetical protein